VSAKAADDRLIGELVSRTRARGLQLTSEGGLLQQLTKGLLESALEGEITDHLGYDKHDPVGKDGGNSRNGKRSKTVLTDVGPVEIVVPRDRDGSFEPKIVKKRHKRLTGVHEMVISLAAKGLTTAEAQARLGRGLWRRGLQADHLHHHRRGPRGHGRVAEQGPSTRSIRWSSPTPST
jgi:putative transposase